MYMDIIFKNGQYLFKFGFFSTSSNITFLYINLTLHDKGIKYVTSKRLVTLSMVINLTLNSLYSYLSIL